MVVHGISRHKSREWIETVSSGWISTLWEVSPGIKAGSGLKLMLRCELKHEEKVSPGIKAGSGLKLVSRYSLVVGGAYLPA